MGKREHGGQIVPAAETAAPPPETTKHGGGGRWAVVDSGGRVAVIDVDKHAIMHRVGCIHARDMRILDPILSYPSAILVRESAIILNLEHIKAIITAEEVFLRNPSDEHVIPIVEQLKRFLPLANTASFQEDGDRKDMIGDDNDESPFELRALEVTLEGICSYLAARTTELENAAYPALNELTFKVTSRNLDRVRKIKSAMTRLNTKVQKVRDEIEQLLDDDDDMADLYLSRKLVIPPSPSSRSGAQNWFARSPTTCSVRISRASRASVAEARGEENDVEEVEMLLEAYFSQIDDTLNKLATLREYVDDTEDYINIQIDSRRNQLIQLELFLNAAMLATSIYSLVTAIFGANIPYTWNDHHGYMFQWVLVVAGIISICMFGCLVSYSRYKGLID